MYRVRYSSISDRFGLVSGSFLLSVQIDISGLRQFWRNFTCVYREKARQCVSNIGKITKKFEM